MKVLTIFVLRLGISPGNKKADAIVAPPGLHRVGLLFNEPSSIRWAALYLVFRLLFSFNHSHHHIVLRLGAKASADN